MRPVGYLLAVLCVALGAQVADAVAAKKSSRGPAPVTATSSVTANTKAAAQGTTTLAAGMTPASGTGSGTSTTAGSSTGPAGGPAAVTPGAVAGKSLLATKKSAARMITYRATRRGIGSEQDAYVLSTPALEDVEANLTDASGVKAFSYSNKPPVKPGAYPFIVSVLKTCGVCSSHPRHFCAGALVAPHFVLSLGQCAELNPGDGMLLVKAGDSFLWPGDNKPVQRVIEIIWHDAAGSGEDNPRYDAILLRLESGFQFSDYINAISLPPANYHPDGGVTVVGWGLPGSADHIELHATKGVVRPTDECQRIAPQEVLMSSMLCTQPTDPAPDNVCKYDPSDPVIVETAEGPVLVGLVSRWYLPCTADKPVVALQVSPLLSWIHDKVTYLPTVAPSPPTLPATSPPTPPTPVFTPPPQPPFTPPPPPPPPPYTTAPSLTGGPVTMSSPFASTTATPPQAVHVKPMTVSSSSASGVMSNTSSTSDTALLLGRMESSLSYSLGTAGVEPHKPALSNSVSVGWANCHGVSGALGMSYSLAYSYVSEGTATSASTVNATCADVNAVQSQGWSMSSSGMVPLNVRAFVEEHLASIPGLHRQPTLKYL